MRIGLAGVGRIGAFHAETLARLPQVDELLIADTDAVRARSVADKIGADKVGVRTAADISELLGSALDGLVIAAATGAHAPLLIAAADAGIPAFCEKPVAPDVEGTLAVLDRVRSTGAAVHVGFQRRFDAGYRNARQALQEGRLGWVHTLRATTLDPAPPPAAYIATSGGMFRDCSVHDFDIIRWVTGREVVRVYATGSNRGAGFFAAADDVDTLAAVLTLDDDSLAVVSATRYNGAGYDVRLEVLGSQDSLSVGVDDRLPLHSAEPGAAQPIAVPYPNFMERFGQAYTDELTAFTELIASGGPSPCTVEDALEAFYVAEACERSRHERRPVDLAEVRRG
ncbi:MAG TPA: Gfo/Idh/MocA family oxidoreductase [Mycobacteriales bacterium]|jgi:myo-inositol 2-dehydrogenase/D-chiro-inositol 1-dehydrogenase|nr:Gfo/Idh/MocA family oxidoreductase [Mycobacteriales bacterium]